MTDPTPEQIEAGRAAVLANFHPPTDMNPTWHLNPDEVARAVLVAAAGAAPQEAAGEHTSLIADARKMLQELTYVTPARSFKMINSLAGALAALAQVDEAKLAEVIWEEQESRVLCGYVIHTRATAATTAAAVAEWLRGGGR